MEFAILVTITGLVVVFAALIALSGAIWIMGKLMSAITGNKSGKNDGEKAKATAVAAPANTNVAQATVNSGISGDVVAAISAAVAMMMGGKAFAVKSIKRAKSARPAWASAGVVENTRPF